MQTYKKPLRSLSFTEGVEGWERTLSVYSPVHPHSQKGKTKQVFFCERWNLLHAAMAPCIPSPKIISCFPSLSAVHSWEVWQLDKLLLGILFQLFSGQVGQIQWFRAPCTYTAIEVLRKPFLVIPYVLECLTKRYKMYWVWTWRRWMFNRHTQDDCMVLLSHERMT